MPGSCCQLGLAASSEVVDIVLGSLVDAFVEAFVVVALAYSVNSAVLRVRIYNPFRYR